MTRFLFIRHGANDAQKEGVLTGWTPGIRLNQEGWHQAKALAQRLASVDIAAVYASPLERTLETAEIVAEPHGLPVQVCASLGEVDVGRWAGQPLEKLRKRRLWRQVQFVPSAVHFPGGESFYAVQSRAVAELEDLRAKHPQRTLVVVSHADVIKSVVAYYIGLSLDLFQRLVIAPASLSILEFGDQMPYLLCLNDTSHLTALEEKSA
jgi:probable phosphoglycerate mutase